MVQNEFYHNSYLSLYDVEKKIRIPTATQHLAYLEVVIQCSQLLHNLMWWASSYTSVPGKDISFEMIFCVGFINV